MAQTRGFSGPAVGLAAAGGLLVYAGVTGKPPLDALRELVKGAASPPAPWARPQTAGPGASVASGAGAGPMAGAAQTALAQVGKPYRWGAKGPDRFDCSGLVYFCYRQTDPSYTYLTTYGIIASRKFSKISRADVAAGDLLWKTGHVAIAISGSELVEAYRTGTLVRRGPIDGRGFVAFLRYRLVAPRLGGPQL